MVKTGFFPLKLYLLQFQKIIKETDHQRSCNYDFMIFDDTYCSQYYYYQCYFKTNRYYTQQND